jgi:hypothetical protein
VFRQRSDLHDRLQGGIKARYAPCLHETSFTTFLRACTPLAIERDIPRVTSTLPVRHKLGSKKVLLTAPSRISRVVAFRGRQGYNTGLGVRKIAIGENRASFEFAKHEIQGGTRAGSPPPPSCFDVLSLKNQTLTGGVQAALATPCTRDNYISKAPTHRRRVEMQSGPGTKLIKLIKLIRI